MFLPDLAIIIPLIYWLVIAAVTSIIVWVGLCFSARTKWLRRHAMLMVLALALLGTTAGLIGGLSRVGAAGQIISATLSLIGGVGVFLFATKQAHESAASAIATISFVIALFVSFIAGAQLRDRSDQVTFWRSQCVQMLLSKKLTDPFLDKNFGIICGAIIRDQQSKLTGQEG